MSQLNRISSNLENIEIKAEVNSIDDVKKFLAKNNVKNFVIEKVAQSFMAKIPTGTVVKLSKNILHIGESMINLGEDILIKTEGTKALVEQTKNRALKIMEHNLPATKTTKTKLAA